MRALLLSLVKRPIGVGLSVVAVAALGVLSLFRLPLGAMPAVSRPAVRALADVPGAGMERVEADVARRVEEALLVVPGSDTVVVWSADGLVAADATFRWGEAGERARLAVVEALEGVRPLAGPPLSFRVELVPPSERPALLLVVSGAQPLEVRSALAEEVLAPALAGVPGVARVEVLGGARRRTVVRPDGQRLAMAGVAPGAVRTALQRAARSTRLGQVVVDGTEADLLSASHDGSPVSVAGLSVPLPGNASARLGELAAVDEELWADHGELRVTGLRAVGIAVHLASDANALTVDRALANVLAGLSGRLPAGVTLERLMDRLDELRQALLSLLLAAALGAVVAGVILGVFVRRLGPLALLLAMIPLSLCAALPVFEVLGLGLNLVSLVGMALAVGMLVDAAVVVLDACLEQGAAAPGATRAVDGTASVTRAIVASAVTTAMVFVPALYLRHLAAALYRELAIALIITLLASLVLALLVTPVVAARLAPSARRGMPSLHRAYRRGLSRLMARSGWSLAAVAGAGVAAAAVAVGLPQQLLTPDAAAASEVRFVQGDQLPPMTLPPSAAEVLERLRDDGERDILAMGLEPASGPPLSAGFWYMPRPRTTAELERAGRSLELAIPGLVVTAAGPAGGVLEALPLRRLAVEVRGLDRGPVERAAGEVASALRRAGCSPFTDLPPERVSLVVRPTALGRSQGDQLEGALEAVLASPAPLDLGQVRLDERALAAADPSGALVWREGLPARPLSALVELDEVRRPSVLVRRQGQVAVRLVVGEPTAEISRVERALTAARAALPPEVDLVASGGIADWHEARAELVLAVGLGLVLVTLVLAAVYESFQVALVVLSVLPFAALGGLLGQRLAGQGLDLGCGLGLVLLVGLAVNNGVLLVDRLRDCEGGPALWARRAARRLRPVLVTSLTTLATLAPVAYAGGAGAALRATLARTAFTGLLLSVPAALLVLPPLARLVLGTRRGGGRVRG